MSFHSPPPRWTWRPRLWVWTRTRSPRRWGFITATRRVDNRKFKDQFGCKARMLSPEDTEAFTGNAAGGVCPFLVPDRAQVWLDVSLRDHDTVYPAAGSAHSGVALSCAELEKLAKPAGWCDVCKPLEVQI